MSSARATKRSTARSKSPDMTKGETPGLRQIVQNRFLKDVFESAAEKHDSWKVLIVDEHAMRVISCSVGMFDIMERKVTVVESLEKKRGPFPDMDAIYVLNPSESSIEKMLDDFERPKPLYGKAVFLYFLGHLPDELFNKIKGCKQLIKRVKGFSEINVDFLPKEERAFTFDMKDLFPALYLRRGTSQSVEHQIAEKLVTVCGTLNEYPHIRYTNNSASCQSLATLFKIKMDDFVAQNPKWWYHGGTSRNQSSTAKERGTLLLLDRADDCLTPLMHDFTYQAMVYDLLDLNGDMITYSNDKGMKTDVLLDEKDAVWVELRGKHIAQVIETLSDRIKEIMNSSTGSTLNVKPGQGNLSMAQMAAALKALPEYQEVMSKLSQHMHLSHECMDIFSAKQLIDLAEIEQTLATGKDEDDRSPRIADAMDKVEESLLRMKTLPEKLRLILIAVIACEGLRAQDKRRLTAAAELTAREMRIFDALEVMGLAVVNANDKNRNLEGLPHRLVKAETEYTAVRYVPLVKSTLEALANNELSLDDYPSVTPMPVQATARTNNGKSPKSGGGAAVVVGSARKRDGGTASRFTGADGTKRSTGPMNFAGGRSMVFVVGGCCYSELRVAREVMEAQSREIIMGGTSFLTTEQFLDDLGKLAEENRR